jgi:TfuA protein
MRDERPLVFVGPSVRQLGISGVEIRPPIRRGDLSIVPRGHSRTILIIDGAFLHLAPPTHNEFLQLLSNGHAVYGAASMGALRAVELRQFGMVGLGKIYQAILKEIIADDSELGVAYCPFTGEAVSIPLINVRAALGLACSCGLGIDAAARLFESAKDIFFFERTQTRLLRVWSASAVDGFEFVYQLLSTKDADLKERDALNAIEFVRGNHSIDQSTFLFDVPLYTTNGVVWV